MIDEDFGEVIGGKEAGEEGGTGAADDGLVVVGEGEEIGGPRVGIGGGNPRADPLALTERGAGVCACGPSLVEVESGWGAESTGDERGGAGDAGEEVGDEGDFAAGGVGDGVVGVLVIDRGAGGIARGVEDGDGAGWGEEGEEGE